MSGLRAFLAAALVALPGAVRSQQAQQGARLRGAVHVAGGNVPIPGAVVTVVDSGGAQTARGIADAQGRFSIVLPAHPARIHAVRIGYRPVDTEVPAKLDVPLELVMERIPPLLEAVKVSDTELCPGSAERGAAFALWDQARAGLLTAVVARDLNPATARTLTYERRLAPNDGLVRDQHTTIKVGQSTRPFASAAGPSYFASVGYMSESSDGRIFNAPDADVLLDPSFAATHCFHLQRADREHAGQIGLAFVPAPGRDTLVDVSGVIWIDAATPQLRSFDFLYTSLEPAAIAMHTGGRLEFRNMPNGVSFIERWFLRLPMLTPVSSNGTYRPNQPAIVRREDRNDLAVTGIAEGGGIVLDAEWADGDAWHAPPTIVAGDVTQRKSTLAVANAIVTLAGTSDSATTDTSGHFAMRVIPGRYTLVAADTLLREFVPDRADKRVVVAERDRTTTVHMEVDRVANVVADVCRGQDMPEKRSIVIGHTFLPSGEIPPEAHVVANWQDDIELNPVTGLQVNTKRQDATIDDRGRFVICGVVRERPIHLRLFLGRSDVLADTTFRIFDERLVLAVAWRLSPNVVADGATLSGTVVGLDHRPLDNAEVSLPQIGRLAVTDADGRFQIGAVKPGTYVAQVRRIGYAQATDSLTLSARARLTRSFTLKQASVLDTVRTLASTSHYVSANLRDFEERSRAGQGRFIADSELRRHDDERTADVLRTLVPGLRIQNAASGAIVMSSRDGRSSKLALEGGSQARCFTTIYLDGILLYDIESSPRNQPPPNINDYPVNSLTGIEFHAEQGTLPVRFKTGECGTLLLWSRER
ncbi:MAG TPA: carboxypeptidase regulatory-like domain-containing protein [Gemmatimonadaceae bacterium]|nr:carboxypeptidase regulatory-like domain-containing protein [Gemmatimonadaceae bacterium]